MTSDKYLIDKEVAATPQVKMTAFTVFCMILPWQRVAVLTAQGPFASSWDGVSVAPSVAAVDDGTSLDASLCVLP
jgi:hypothetical protein